MDAGIEVKVESDDEVEPYDGSYACLICTESVRGQPALVCSKCNSNPFHRTCDPESKYAEVCPTCGQKTVEAWKGGRAGTAAASEMMDLTGEGGGGAEEVARLTEPGGEEGLVPGVGGGVVGADEGGRDAVVRRAGSGSGRSGKGKEPAGGDWGGEAGGDGGARDAGAGAVGGGGKGKGRVDKGSARAGRGSSGGG